MKFILFFLLYLFPEVLITSEFANAFGGFWLFIEIVGSALLGVFVLANFRFSAAENLRAMAEGRMGQGEFMTAQIFRLVGAVMLIVPGVMTDGLGLLLQLESLAGLVAGAAGRNLNRNGGPSGFKEGGPYHHTNQNPKGESSEIIDVEVIDSPDSRR